MYLGLKFITLLVFEIMTPALGLSVAISPTSGAALTARAVLDEGFGAWGRFIESEKGRPSMESRLSVTSRCNICRDRLKQENTQNYST